MRATRAMAEQFEQPETPEQPQGQQGPDEKAAQRPASPPTPAGGATPPRAAGPSRDNLAADKVSEAARAEFGRMARELRAARTELAAVQADLGRERENLARVRESLAGQRLAMQAQAEQLERQGDQLSIERAQLEEIREEFKLEKTHLETQYRRIRAQLEGDLGQRQRELRASVSDLTERRASLEREIAGRLADVEAREKDALAGFEQERKRRLASLEKELADERKAGAEEIKSIRRAAEAEQRQRAERADAEIEQHRAKAEGEIAARTAKADEEIARRRERSESAARRLRESVEHEVHRREEALEKELADLRARSDREIAKAHEKADAEIREKHRTILDRVEKREAEAEAEKQRLAAEAVRQREQLAREVEAKHAQADAEIREKHATILDRVERREAEVAARQELLDTQEREQRAKLEADVAAFEAHRTATEERLRTEREEFDRKTAEVQARIASLDKDLARLEKESARVAQQRTESEELAGRLAEREKVTAAAEKEAAKLAKSQEKKSKELMALGLRLAKQEETVLGREKEAADELARLKKDQGELKEQQKAMQKQHREQAEALEKRLGEMEKREKQTARTEERVAADAEASARRISEAEAALAERVGATENELAERRAATDREVEQKQKELAEAWEGFERDNRQLRREQSALARQKEEVEDLARQARDDLNEINRKEGAVLSGWEEVRRAKAEIALTQERLSQRARELLAGRAGADAEPLEAPEFTYDQRPTSLPRAGVVVHKRWLTGVAAAAAVVLVLVQAAVYLAVPQHHEATGNMRITVAAVGGDNAAPSAVVSRQLHNFAISALPGDSVQRPLNGLVGDRWRADMVPSVGGLPQSDVTVRVTATDRTTKAAVNRVNGLLRDFNAWREQQLRSVGIEAAAPDLLRMRKQADDTVQLLRQEEQAQRGQLLPAFDLAEVEAPLQPRQLLAALDTQLVGDGEKLGEAGKRFEDLSARQAKAAAELNLLEEEVRRLESSGRVASEQTAELIRRQVDLDNQLLKARVAELEQLLRVTDQRLQISLHQWDQAVKRLADLLAQPNLTTGDEKVVAARENFDASQLALHRAIKQASPNDNNLIMALQQQVAELQERVQNNSVALVVVDGMQKREARIAELNRELESLAPNVVAAQQDLRQLRARAQERSGRRAAYAEVVDRLGRASARQADLLSQLQAAGGLDVARVSVELTPADASTVVVDNPRPQWMIVSAAGIVLFAAVIALIGQFVLTRWGGAAMPILEDEPEPEPERERDSEPVGKPAMAGEGK